MLVTRNGVGARGRAAAWIERRTGWGGHRRRGYILVMFSLSLFLLLGVCGLAVDVGRMYLVKSETQSFADAATLNAIVQLAGNPAGFTAAKTAASQTNKKWQFGYNDFTNVVTTFGTSATDTFIANPPAAGKNASDYKYVLVQATANVPMYLMGAAIRQSTASVAAQSMAGEIAVTGIGGGEFPFSPYSRKNNSPEDVNDPFGFKVGGEYTLRWDPPGDKTTCGTDSGNVGGNGSFRGYCCTGGQSVPAIRDVLAGGGTVPMNVGDDFGQYEVNGQKDSIDIEGYINKDTDTLSPDYATYKANGNGNGVRVVTVPVNDDMNTGKLVGFAAFFLYPASSYGKFNICGEYVGFRVTNAPVLPPASGSGTYHIKLVQ